MKKRKNIKKKPRKHDRNHQKSLNRDYANAFEKVVARLYQELSPTCKVTHDDKILGHDSKTKRQIDVSIRGMVSGHEILIIVNTKNQSSKVDINQVGELKTVMKDVLAHKGVLVCNRGFTSGAKSLASKSGIDLCSIHDASTRDWKLDIALPIIWEELGAELNFNCTVHLEAGMQLNEDSIFNVSNIDIRKKFAEDWNNGNVDYNLDKVNYDLNVDKPEIQTLDGRVVPLIDLNIDVLVNRRFFFGYFTDLPTARALKNENTGLTDLLISHSDFDRIDKSTLLKIETPESSPVDIKTHLRVLQKPTVLFRTPGGQIKIQKIG